MASKNKHRVMQIRPGPRDQLSISWDYDTDPNDPKQRRAVLLHVPDVRLHDHNHLELTNYQAKFLRDWLTRYLDEVKQMRTKSRNRTKKTMSGLEFESPMTPKEFSARMRSLQVQFKHHTAESRQEHRVNLLCEVLTSLGYGNGVKVFKRDPGRD